MTISEAEDVLFEDRKDCSTNWPQVQLPKEDSKTDRFFKKIVLAIGALALLYFVLLFAYGYGEMTGFQRGYQFGRSGVVDMKVDSPCLVF